MVNCVRIRLISKCYVLEAVNNANSEANQKSLDEVLVSPDTFNRHRSLGIARHFKVDWQQHLA